ncbi:MAG: hypothetical protein AAFY71_15515 [Bacteroidota bacterium]
MDKRDQLIRNKVREARPFSPQANWGKMEKMLLEDAVASGKESKKRGKWVLLLGFAAGFVTCLVLGFAWYSLQSQQQDLRAGSMANTVQQETSPSSTIQHQPNHTSGTSTPHSLESATTQSVTHTEQPKQASSFIPPTANSAENTAEAAGQSSDRLPSTHSASPFTTNKHTFSSKGDNIQGVEANQTQQAKQLKSVEELAQIPSNSAGEQTAQEPSSKHLGSQSLALPHQKDGRTGLDLLALNGMEIVLDEGSIVHHSNEISPIPFPDASLKAQEKKWRAGMYISGLIQPYVGISPVSINNNPLVYRWHPSIRATVIRTLNRQLEVEASLGTDDAFYYEGYLPSGAALSRALPDGGNSAIMVIGTNYWLEVGARWKPFKERFSRIQPYVKGAVAAVNGRYDYLQIFNLDITSLPEANKSSRLRARSNLDYFSSNPYLVNNSDYVSGTSFSFSPAEYQLDYQVQNNLSTSLKSNQISFSLGVGAEIPVGEKWAIDVQAEGLSRLLPGQSQLSYVYQLESDVEVALSQGPFVQNRSRFTFGRLTIGLNRKF